jgi:hypothetical protein
MRYPLFTFSQAREMRDFAFSDKVLLLSTGGTKEDILPFAHLSAKCLL